MKKCFIGNGTSSLVKVSRKAPKVYLKVWDIEDIRSILLTPDENGGVMFNEEQWNLIVEASSVVLMKPYCRKVYYRDQEFLLDIRSNHIYDVVVFDEKEYYVVTESYKIM